MNKLFWQIARFGTVGVTAATVHFMVVVAVVQTWALPPLLANIVGFVFSFQVSYFGHRHFTFDGADILHRVALPRLLTVQTIGLVANETLFYIFLSFHWPYKIALLMVLAILPIFTFLLSKLWVFR